MSWTVPNQPPRQRCSPCRHRLRFGTCGKPVDAGLSESPGVVAWAIPGSKCPAFQPRATPPAQPNGAPAASRR